MGNRPPIRLLFIGQKPLGEAAWERIQAIQDERLQVVAVCSNQSTDNVWWRSNRIYRTAGSARFIDNARRNDSELLEAIDALGINFVLIVQYPWLLSPALLQRVGGNVLSFHSAKLPEYRGHNSFSHALLNRDRTYTISVTWVSERLDRGELAYESAFPIAADDTALSLYAKGFHVALRLLDTVLERLRSGEPLPRRPQSGQPRFYRIDELHAHREIRASAAEEVDVKSRAFYFPPYEPAYMTVGERRVYVLPESARHDVVSGSRTVLDEALARHASAALDIA